MKVVLITERGDLAADLLVQELKRVGAEYVRFNQDQYPATGSIDWTPDAALGLLRTGTVSVDGREVSGFWFRRLPNSWDLSQLETDAHPLAERECAATILGLAAGCEARWINPPLNVQLAENKLAQLRLGQSVGLRVPATKVGNGPTANTRANERPAAVVKSVTGGGVEVNGSPYFLRADVQTMPLTDEEIAACPTVFQDLVEPAYHLRVVVVDDQMFGTSISYCGPAEREPIDWRAVDDQDLDFRRAEVPDDVARGLAALLSRLQLRYCSADFVVDHEGGHWFLDLNPSGQWGWIEARTQEPLTAAIVDALSNRRRDGGD